MNKFPGRGGGKKCAESFGVSPQQWSPWERGMRTPDELRLSQIADFFGVTVEYLRRDNSVKPVESSSSYPYPSYAMYSDVPGTMPPSLREPEAPPYGLPSFRREDTLGTLSNISELSQISARLLNMMYSTTRGVIDGRFDPGKTIVVLRRLGDILEQKLREVDGVNGNYPPQNY